MTPSLTSGPASQATPEAFLGALRTRGVRVSAPGDGRLIFSPKGSLTPEELSTAKDLKPGILEILAAEAATPAPMSQGDVEAIAASTLGPCDTVEVLPRIVADVRWQMLSQSFHPRSPKPHQPKQEPDVISRCMQEDPASGVG